MATMNERTYRRLGFEQERRLPAHPVQHDALHLRNLRAVPRVRHRVRDLGAALGMSERRIEEGAVVASELANNLVQHGGGGTVLLRAMEAPMCGVEMVLVDHGPGMPQPPESERGRGLGQGLPAAERLADTFDVMSAPGDGTIVLARILDRPFRSRPVGALEYAVGGINVCHPFETRSGDAWSYWLHGPALTVLLVDGIGHGSAANEAAAGAVERFDGLNAQGLLSQRELVTGLDQGLRQTRGCVATWATVDLDTGRHAGLGLGNAAGVFWHGHERHDIPLKPGVVGAGRSVGVLPTPNERVRADGWAIIASDGLDVGWRTQLPARWETHHPTTVAAKLWRDHAEGGDDASVVAVRWREAAP